MTHPNVHVLAYEDDDEMVARVTALYRRSKLDRTTVHTRANLSFNTRTGAVLLEGEPLRMAPGEKAILGLLIQRGDRITTKLALADGLNRTAAAPRRNLKIIDVYICYIRKKLAREATSRAVYGPIIETIWGRGYRIAEPSP